MTTAKSTNAAQNVSKADDAKAGQDAKPSKKALTQGEKINVLVKAARANGWSLPDELDDGED